ncbi:MAG: ABC transporter ATP-binding protein/permease [Deltaproteobacteria bacterium]|nr:ABC transporter ATP-binding protein/permease [Deltaproteobacteria bacterium]
MKNLRYLLPFFARYRLKWISGLVCVAGMAFVGLASPWVVGDAIDNLRGGITHAKLLGYAGLLVGIAIVQGLFSFGQRRILVAMSRDIERDLRNDFLDHLQALPPSFFQRSFTGDLMARATNDIEAVRQVCGPAVMYSANTVLAGCGALLLMTLIHPWLTLVAVCTLPLVAVASRYFGVRIHAHFEKVQEQYSSLSSRVQESLAGGRVVRAFAREHAEDASFRGFNRDYVERNRRLILWTSAFRPMLQLLIGLGYVAVLCYGGLATYLGEMTVGDLVKFNLFLGKLTWPMIAVGWVINLLQRGAASLTRIYQVLGTEPEIRDRPPLVNPTEIRGEISFRGLDFSYQAESDGAEEVKILRGIDLEVPAGSTVAVVGRTGAGKSTLLSLIPRLIEPPEGSIWIDGVDIRHLPLERLRSEIGVVPQEAFLFSTTVRENIALGAPEATMEEIQRAAQLAGLEDDLKVLPQGFDTLVGERGVTLSGGQKQRVALARALLRQPTFLLLDDCLSAVDTQTEERILENFRQVFRNRTVFLVAHRISTVKDADLILVLEQGRITQRGDHQQLISQPGLYGELHRRQQLEEQLAAV